MGDGRRETPGRNAWSVHRDVLLGALDGVELNEAEVGLVDWLAIWDDWTVTTTAMRTRCIRVS